MYQLNVGVEAWRTKHPIAFEGEVSIKNISLSSVLVKAERNSTVQTINVCTTYFTYEFIGFRCAGPPGDRHYPGEPGCVLEGKEGGPRIEMYTVPHIQCETFGGENPPSGEGGGGNGGSTTPTPPGGYDPCESGPVAVTSAKTRQNRSIFKVPPSDCEPQPETDCAGVAGGTAYIDPNCNTCIGGTTGITACLREIKIDTSITNNPKLKCLLEKLLGLNGNTANPQFMALLNAFNNKGFDVTFKIGSLQNNNANAETAADPNDPTKYNVVLNTNKIYIA